MTSSIKVVDKGMERILRELPYLRGASVDVGVQSDAGTGDDGETPIAAYAAWNEFGTSRAPARPFMAQAADENGRKWTQTAGKILNSIYEGRSTAEAGLAILGQMAEDDIKNKITTLKEPPNSPMTIALKGSANPLIDNNNLRQSIRYVVNI